MNKSKSLTTGTPWKLLLEFSIPILIGQIFQLLYSLFDTKIVGAILGEAALSAVGSVSTLYNLLTSFANGLTMGFAILLAFHYGAENYDKVKKIFASAIELTAIITIIITILLMAFLSPIMAFLNIPSDQLQMAQDYIAALIIGLFITMAYNLCANCLRAIGDSITPLIYLIIASIGNVVMDIIFVKYFGWGVAGAAYATVLAQLISVILCISHIKRKFTILHVKKNNFIPDKDITIEMLKNGLAMGLMSSLVNLGSFILQSAINSLGTQIIVAHTAARKVCEIMMMPGMVIAYGITTFSSQNNGAGRIDRVKDGLKSAMYIGIIWCIITIILMFAFSENLVSFIASSQDETVLYWGSVYLKFDLSLNIICYAINVLRNMLQGLGCRITPIISSGIELLGKIVFAYTLVPALGYVGVILTEPIVWIAMVIPLIVKAVEILKDK